MQDVEDVIKVFAAEKQEDEKSTEYKKAKSKPDKKKPTGRKKVKMRSKKEGLLTVCVEFPRISHGKKKGPRNRHPRHRKTKEKGKGTKHKFSMQTNACSRNGIQGLYSSRKDGSRLNEMFEKDGR